MAKVINLPQLGQTMEEGTIVNCLVSVGDKVSKGDVIFEVETDKATLEMECPEEGTVAAILVEVGKTVLVNEPVIVVGEENEEIDIAELTGSSSTAPSVDNTDSQANSTNKSGLPASAKVINLPQLGQTMEEGTIVNCLVSVGDKVSKGDVIFEVETDKATLEMECPEEGTVAAVLVKTGQTVLVNEPVLIFCDEDITDDMIASVVSSDSSTQEKEDNVSNADDTTVNNAAETQADITNNVAEANTENKSDRIFASPRAKMTAKKMGISLVNIDGSGANGRIIEKDVLAQSSDKNTAKLSMPEPEYSLGQVVAVSKIQKITGDKMLQSKQQLPCFYLNTTVDMTRLVKHRAEVNKSSNVKIAFNDFIIRAMGIALRQFPIMAGQLKGDNIKIADEINVGLAISVGSDLLAPVVKNVDRKNAGQIAADSKNLIAKAGQGKLGADDLSGGCMTLSNLGAFGVESFIPIVVPGQCSILGVGKIKDAVVPEDGNLMVRKMMAMTIAVDHKIANGAYAAQFLDYIKTLLETVEKL